MKTLATVDMSGHPPPRWCSPQPRRPPSSSQARTAYPEHAADKRASLLIDATGAGDDSAGAPPNDPLMQGVFDADWGRWACARRRRARLFSGAPPGRAGLRFSISVSFALRPERAHFIGGFGRIASICRRAIFVSLGGRRKFASSEAGIVSHMNEDHADAIELYATSCSARRGRAPGAMTGIDPEGCDLVLGARGLVAAVLNAHHDGARGTSSWSASSAWHGAILLSRQAQRGVI